MADSIPMKLSKKLSPEDESKIALIPGRRESLDRFAQMQEKIMRLRREWLKDSKK